MATSSKRGGGFSIGAIYGLIVSGALYLVLVYLFPLNLIDQSVAPSVMDSAGSDISTSDAGPELGAQPVSTEMGGLGMTQPETGENASIAIGGAGDSGPAAVTANQIAETAGVSDPTVATETVAVPDIGNGTPETAAPGEQGAAPTTTTVEAVAEPVEPPAELAQSVSGPATEVFAVPFTGDTTKPMLAIVLLDTLEGSIQPLIGTGEPLNFALPADEDSRETAQSLRQSGFEVVGMIPSGVNRNGDVAGTIQQFMQNVPVAVALLDANTSGLMLNRASMQTVLETTRPAGLGLIAFAGAGDLVAKDQALRAGAPFGTVVQIIDRTDDAALIVQALDRAAFDAITSGSAIVFARTRPKTIEALIGWLEGAFARRLQIVPVSVAIQRSAN